MGLHRRGVLVALLVFASVARADQGVPVYTAVPTLPVAGGACSGSRVQVEYSSGKVWCCSSGAWAACNDPAAVPGHTHPGGEVTSQVADAGAVDGIDSARIVYGTNSTGTTASGTDYDSLSKTGFYRFSPSTDWPSQGWIIHFQHPSDSGYAFQFSGGGYSGTDVGFRKKSAGTWGSPFSFITSANIGSQAVASAATADNALALANKPTSLSGDRWNVIPYVASDGVLEAGRFLDFHESDGDTSDYSVRVQSVSGNLTISGNAIVHAGNIASQSVSFATTAGSATTATTAGALSGSPSLCSAGQAARGITANGNAAGCWTPSAGDDGERVYLGSNTACTSGGVTIFSFSYAASSRIHLTGTWYPSTGSGTLQLSCAPSGSVSSLGIAAEAVHGGGWNPATWTASAATTSTTAAVVGTTSWTALGSFSFRGFLSQSTGGGSGTVACKCISSAGNISVLAGSWSQVHVDN